MSIDKIRSKFPVLASGKHVYLDNACMSLKPRQVVEAMDRYYYEFPACAGRSNHAFGERVTAEVGKARQSVAELIGADPSEIIFLRNATEGLNLVANSLDLATGDIVLTTDREHNSNLIPWQRLADKKGIIHKVVRSKEDNSFDIAAFEEVLSSGAKLVSMVYTSNLDGVTIPAEDIIRKAHEKGSLVMLDAAQAVAHHKIDVKKLGVDFLVFSGHKICGPTGTGVLYMKKEMFGRLEPYNVGGDTVEYSTYEGHKMMEDHHKFEAGLQDYAGIIGLGEACRYISAIGYDFIARQVGELNERASRGIGGIRGIRVIGPVNSNERGGVLSFNVDGLDCHQVSLLLNNMAGVMVRSGQHCVHSWFHAHGIKGSVRASFAFYNTKEEADIFLKALEKIVLLG